MKLLKPISQDATRAFQEKYGDSSPRKQRALQFFHPRKFGAMFDEVVAREQLCKDAVQQARRGIIVLDSHGKILAANSELEGIFGASGADAIGKSALELLSGFLDNEQMMILSSQLESRREGNKGQYELSITVNGAPKAIMITATPRTDKAGRVIGSISVIEDITEMKKEHEQLEIFFSGVHNCPVAIAIIGVSGETVYANGSYERLVGAQPGSLPGTVPPTLLQAPIRQIWSSAEFSKMMREKSEWRGQVSFAGGENGNRTLETHLSPISAKDGKVLSFLLIHEDVTIFQDAISTRDKLLSILFHDVRNPTGTIMNFSSILLEDYERELPAEAVKFLKNINGASQQILQIILDLNEWSSGAKFTPVKFDLQLAISRAIELNNMGAAKKGIELSCENGGNEVFADQKMAYFILRNLIANSVKFTDKGGFIHVSVEDKGGYAQVAVTDNGIGIPPGKLALIFSGGEKISSKGTTGELGTGFGLVTCKEFTEKMGGKIWVESVAGEGSTFFFTLPKQGPDGKA